MIKIDEVRLGILPLSLWAVSGIMACLSAVETSIVRVPSPLSYSSLIPSLVPSSLPTSSLPIGWCATSG